MDELDIAFVSGIELVVVPKLHPPKPPKGGGAETPTIMFFRSHPKKDIYTVIYHYFSGIYMDLLFYLFGFAIDPKHVWPCRWLFRSELRSGRKNGRPILTGQRM